MTLLNGRQGMKFSDKYKLAGWLETNNPGHQKEMPTYKAVALAAMDDLGFEISLHHVARILNELKINWSHEQHRIPNPKTRWYSWGRECGGIA